MLSIARLERIVAARLGCQVIAKVANTQMEELVLIVPRVTGALMQLLIL